MALRVSRIENFDELWCLVASRGLDISVLSTSFQKSNIGWPPTEKVLKIKVILVLLKIIEVMNLDESEVLSKGQLISKADLGAADSPKKRTNEFVFFLT